MRNRGAQVLLLLALCACSNAEPAPANTPAVSCETGYQAHAGVCIARLDACAEGEVPKLGGGCTRVGVPAGGCAPGFTHGNGGCLPTLPSAPCPKGQLAIPGEATCRELAPCGAAPWGDIPIDARTIFVDAAYAGGSSDGSKGKPFTTIAAALDAVPPGENPIVAIAAGTYASPIRIAKPARLYGRCPSMVEIVGDGSATAVIEVLVAAEVHGVAVTGRGIGLLAYDVQPVVIESSWFHDLNERGIDIEAPRRPTSATVRNVLVERASRAGIAALGAKVAIERSAVRDTQRIGTAGFGVLAQADPARKNPAEISLRTSLVQGSYEGGVAATGSKAEIEASAILDTHSPSTAKPGPGVVAQTEPTSMLAADVTVRASFVARSEGVAVSATASSLKLERVTIDDTRVAPIRKDFGVGVELTRRSTLAMTDSLVRRSHTAAINVVGSDATIERCALHETLPRDLDDMFGVGISVASDPARMELANASLRDVAVDRAFMFGVMAHGAKLELARLAVRDVLAQKGDGRFGDGVVLSALEKTPGDGVSALSTEALAEEVFVARVARVGLNAAGSSLSLRACRLSCAAFDLEVGRWFATFGGTRVERDFVLDDRGGNACGCGQPVACKAQSSDLEPAGAGLK